MRTESRIHMAVFTLLIAMLLQSGPAASTKAFTEKSFKDFEKGELKSASLDSKGELIPAPATEKKWENEEAKKPPRK